MPLEETSQQNPDPEASSEPTASGGSSSSTASGLSADELAQVRDLFVTTNPDAIHELIAGSTLAELAASVAGAKSAYARVAEAAKQAVAQAAPPMVPAGGAPAVVVDVASLPTSEKIRRGLEQRRRKQG